MSTMPSVASTISQQLRQRLHARERCRHIDWEGIKTQTRARSGLQELEERFPGTKRLVPDGEAKEEMLQFIKLCALPVCLAIRN